MNKEYINEDGTPFSKEQFIDKIKNDKEFCDKFGNLGPIYGKQWRKWEHYDEIGQHYSSETQKIEQSDILRREPIDQIENLINDLKTNPDSRRLMVSAWNPADLHEMTLPPCHYGFQVYTRELSEKERTILYFEKYGYDSVNMEGNDLTGIPTRAISLMWNQRSVDTGLGLSFNVASYSLLLIMIAKQVNMVPDEVIGNLGDVHLYLNHIEPIKEQLTREPYKLPLVKISDRVVSDISEYTLDDIILENYQSHPTIKMPLSN